MDNLSLAVFIKILRTRSFVRIAVRTFLGLLNEQRWRRPAASECLHQERYETLGACYLYCGSLVRTAEGCGHLYSCCRTVCFYTDRIATNSTYERHLSKTLTSRGAAAIPNQRVPIRDEVNKY